MATWPSCVTRCSPPPACRHRAGTTTPARSARAATAAAARRGSTLGGTLYSAATGGAAVAGATINVIDANGKTVKIVSANNGNFWTTTVLAYPIKVNASLCPATVPMVSTVAGNGACNNCHNSTMQVHVP